MYNMCRVFGLGSYPGGANPGDDNTYIYIYICVYTHMCVHIYIYIYIWREREREIEREMYTCLYMYMHMCIYKYIHFYDNSNNNKLDEKTRTSCALVCSFGYSFDEAVIRDTSDTSDSSKCLTKRLKLVINCRLCVVT